jgi:D-amino-acid oxidase
MTTPEKSRRWLLAFAAANAASASIGPFVRTSWAAPAPGSPPSLNRGRRLQEPNFALTLQGEQCVSGLRPHRTGGVRVELDPNHITGGTQEKYIVHNYGHGGAGITLSFGCAVLVKDIVAGLVARMGRNRIVPSIAVIGSGVIGLTTARELKRQWPRMPMTIYDKDHDVSKTTSWLAGGQFEPSGIFREYGGTAGPPMTVLHDMVRKSHQCILQMNASQRALYGIAVRRNFALHDSDGVPAFDVGTPRDVVPAPLIGRLPFRRLNDVGREYRTWLINPRILLPRLQTELRNMGVQRGKRTFVDNADLRVRARDNDIRENIIINCTGLAAREIGPDSRMRGLKGHLAFIPNPGRLSYFFSGGCVDTNAEPGFHARVAYMFARQTDIVIGGSYNEACQQTCSDLDVGRTLLERMRLVFAGQARDCGPPI